MAVTANLIQTELGRTLNDAERAQADLWIADALAAIEARAIAQGTTLAALDQAVLDRVVRKAVAAAMAAPAEGLTQYDVTVDDTRVSRRYASVSRGLTFLPEWWGWLGLTDGGSGAFSTRPGYAPDGTGFGYNYATGTYLTGYLL